MLSIAKGLLEEEEREQEEERVRYMAESCPPVSMPRSCRHVLRHTTSHKRCHSHGVVADFVTHQ